MGREDQLEGIDLPQRIVCRHRLLFENVQRRTGDDFLVERLDQIGFFDCRPARSIHDQRRRLHELELAHADHAARFPGQNHVQGHDVGLLEQLVKRNHSDVQVSYSLLFHVRIVTENLHAPATEPLCDVLADAADADDTHRPADHQGAAVLQFLPAAVTEERFVELQSLEQRNHQPHGRLGHAQIVLGRRAVAAQDAQVGGRFDVHGLDADARLHYRLEIRTRVQNLAADNIPSGGINDGAVADELNQFLALVAKSTKVILRFSQYQLATGAAQHIFGDFDPHRAGKTDFAFHAHSDLTASCRVSWRFPPKAIFWPLRSDLHAG